MRLPRWQGFSFRDARGFFKGSFQSGYRGFSEFMDIGIYRIGGFVLLRIL